MAQAVLVALDLSLYKMSAEIQDKYTDILSGHGIRPTSVRILVLKAISKYSNTFSLNDLETELESVDKSSIFRTLILFSEHHLVHETEDGSGSTKYCYCHNDHECGVEELHCHFYCEKCHKTYCFEDIHIPIVNYPQGFELHEVEYLLKGLCPHCRKISN